MKIRLLNNSLRIRISQSEADQMIKEKMLTSSTVFPGSMLTYKLVANSSIWKVKFKDNTLMVGIPEEIIEALAIPGFTGETQIIKLDEETEFTLVFEKDFKCLVPREEDESDLYENPRSANDKG